MLSLPFAILLGTGNADKLPVTNPARRSVTISLQWVRETKVMIFALRVLGIVMMMDGVSTRVYV